MAVLPMLTEGALLRLMAWLSPGFPVGGYSYSHGLEFAVEAGLVHDRESLAGWIDGILQHGMGRLDAALFCLAHRAVTEGDGAGLADIAERADAMRATAETALESRAQGTAFLSTLRKAWPDPRLDAWAATLDHSGREPAYCVAVAVAAAIAELPLPAALAAYLHAVVANLVSAGIRLIPLGQTDGQRLIADLEPALLETARSAQSSSLEDLGTSAAMVDWTSMQHETQYTRLFRS